MRGPMNHAGCMETETGRVGNGGDLGGDDDEGEEGRGAFA